MLDYTRITSKWASLRRFAGLNVEAALDSIRQGHVDVAQFFSKLTYFLPFASRSLEKVLLYSLVKASYGFMNKDPSYYEITVDEVPEFAPDEKEKVRSAFESTVELGLADVVSPIKIRIKPEFVNDIVRYIAPYVTRDIKLRDIDLEAYSYPYRLVSGVSSLYVMYKGGRLPSSYTVLSGLLSPTAHVTRKGDVEVKTTIDSNEWVQARVNMSSLKRLKDKFDIEYFKAIGVMHENRIIVRAYPMEVSGMLVDRVVAPAYERYYTLMRQRRIRRTRPWRKQ